MLGPYVRFGSKADIVILPRHVRLTSESGHPASVAKEKPWDIPRVFQQRPGHVNSCVPHNSSAREGSMRQHPEPIFSENARGSTMRYLFSFFTIFLTLVLFSADIMAQTAAPGSPDLSRRALHQQDRQLRQQDRQECTTQATQQNIAKRNRSEFVLKCMADRQHARKAATKK